jgi:hypothetical protein
MAHFKVFEANTQKRIETEYPRDYPNQFLVSYSFVT